MLQFKFVEVRRPTQHHLLVRWGILPTAYDMGDVRFIILHAAAPDGPWEELAVAEPGAFHYVVDNIRSSEHYPHYFIIRAASISGAGFTDSAVATLGHAADTIASEMIRKKEVFLRTKSGISVAVLIRKRWGAKCPRCWDPIRNMASDPDCPDCYGTGFPGGFCTPIFTNALWNPNRDVTIRAGTEYKDDNSTLEFAAFPLLQVGDVVVDRVVNDRYMVTQVQPTTHRMAVVAQLVQAARLDDHSRIHMIPVVEVSGA